MYEGIVGSNRVALKVMPVSDRHTVSELVCYQRLAGYSHDNVINAHLAVVSHDGNAVALPLELAGCDLMAACSRAGGFEEFEAARIFSQVLAGVAFLHENGIYHLDLKPENIMMCGRHASRCAVPQIADFGTSAICPRGSSMVSQSCGTQVYACPEGVRWNEARRRRERQAPPSSKSSPHLPALPPSPKSTCPEGAASSAASRASDASSQSRSSITLDVASECMPYDAAKADVWALGVSLFSVVTGVC